MAHLQKMNKSLVPELSRVSFSSFDDILNSLDDLEAKQKAAKSPRDATAAESTTSPRSTTSTTSPREAAPAPATTVHPKAAFNVKTPIDTEAILSNMCAKCNTKILADKVTAEGKAYHSTCFVCSNCGNKLIGSFFPRAGVNYCVACVEKLNPCGTCGKVIYAGSKYSIDGDGNHHHLDCFSATKTCSMCHRAITGVEVKALNMQLHPDCFRCSECSQLLDGTFVNVDGKIVCVGCRVGKKPKCEACSKPILKDFSEFGGKLYHTECFVCARCKKVIGTDAFFDVASVPVCQACDVWRKK